MASHTITEAMKLVKKGRRTLYDHMASGRLSYGIKENGKRFLETSELIRVYGPLKENSANPHTYRTLSSHEENQICTVFCADKIMALFSSMLNEIKELKQETKKLRSEITDKKALSPPVSLPKQQSEEEQAREKSIRSSLANLRKKIEG